MACQTKCGRSESLTASLRVLIDGADERLAEIEKQLAVAAAQVQALTERQQVIREVLELVARDD